MKKYNVGDILLIRYAVDYPVMKFVINSIKISLEKLYNLTAINSEAKKDNKDTNYFFNFITQTEIDEDDFILVNLSITNER